MRNHFHMLIMSACFIFGSVVSHAQGPALTVTGTPVCSVYSGLCCQKSYINVAGSLPNGWSVNQTNLTQFGFYIPSGQTSAPSYDPSIPSFFGTFPNYELREYSIYGGSYVLNLTFTTPNGPVVASYPFTIAIDNSAAAPIIRTQAKTVPQMESGQYYLTNSFYANDPISFDGTASTGTYEYYLSCTPVTQTGTPTGPTVTDWGPHYSPDQPLNWFGYQNLRTMFSNLVNPSGMQLIKYYRINMIGTGCNGNPVNVSTIISIRNSVRPIKSTIGFDGTTTQLTVAPNPSNGRLTLTSTETIEEIKISIKSMTGQEMYSQESVEFTSETIDLSFLSKGMYLVTSIIDGVESVQRIEIE